MASMDHHFLLFLLFWPKYTKPTFLVSHQSGSWLTYFVRRKREVIHSHHLQNAASQEFNESESAWESNRKSVMCLLHSIKITMFSFFSTHPLTQKNRKTKNELNFLTTKALTHKDESFFFKQQYSTTTNNRNNRVLIWVFRHF